MQLVHAFGTAQKKLGTCERGRGDASINESPHEERAYRSFDRTHRSFKILDRQRSSSRAPSPAATFPEHLSLLWSVTMCRVPSSLYGVVDPPISPVPLIPPTLTLPPSYKITRFSQSYTVLLILLLHD
jgi:hypothetical protein